VEHLVTPNQEDRKIGRRLTLLEILNQPPNWNTRINQHMEDSQGYASDPPQDQTQQHTMDAPMHPSGRVRQSKFFAGHPFILEQPIRDQVNHEGRFESGQGHDRLATTATSPLADSWEKKPVEHRAVFPEISYDARRDNSRAATRSGFDFTARVIDGFVPGTQARSEIYSTILRQLQRVGRHLVQKHGAIAETWV
jgi:hypothetical protein